MNLVQTTQVTHSALNKNQRRMLKQLLEEAYQHKQLMTYEKAYERDAEWRALYIEHENYINDLKRMYYAKLEQ